MYGQVGLQAGSLLVLRQRGALATKEPRKGSEGVGVAFGRARLAWVVVGVRGWEGGIRERNIARDANVISATQSLGAKSVGHSPIS